jgi:hypothetical protein
MKVTNIEIKKKMVKILNNYKRIENIAEVIPEKIKNYYQVIHLKIKKIKRTTKVNLKIAQISKDL